MESALTRLDPLLEPLRPYLFPITTSLPTPIKTFILGQIGETCYEPVVEQLSLATSPACSKLALSKALGVGIVGVSAVVKVPQLLKLIRSGSARGVSFAAYALETIAYTITLAYNYRSGNPLSTYGEIAVLAVQNVMIAVLVLSLKGRRDMAGAFIVALASAVYALFNPDLVSNEHLALCQAATIPLSLASKIPQIWTVYREKSTGQLSAFSVFNYVFGSLARVFTTIAEVNDPVILYGFIGGACLNVVLALQMLWYWNSGMKLGAGTKKKFYAGGSKPKGRKKKLKHRRPESHLTENSTKDNLLILIPY